MNHYVQTESKSEHNPVDKAVANFIALYDSRAAFFTDTFIKKVKEGNRKALAELQRHPLPPTQMDLRQEFTKCLHAGVSDDLCFKMKDGKHYTMLELKRLIPEWSSIAVNALMESDPAMADRLMSSAQWNAKVAFEVAFANAMNEIRDIKKTKQPAANFEHYKKWIIDPLENAIVLVNAVNPPGNALIGYGNRISLAEAMRGVHKLIAEFQKLTASKV
jgi:hypothetical protein